MQKMIESDGRKGLMRTKPLWLGTQLEIHLKTPQGASLNILLKLMSVVALVIAPTVAINVDDIGDKIDNLRI